MKAITCKEAVEFILRKEEGKLSLIDRVRLWKHIGICSLCRIFAIQNKHINEAMAHKHKDHVLTDDDKEHIIRKVLEQEE